jgi:hypothetical protein
VQVQEFEQEAVQMEDRPEDTRIDEDVEGHKANVGQNVGKDEDSDVEGHKHHSPNVPAPTFGREDEGDDVEAHSNFGTPAVPAPTFGREDEGDDVEAHSNVGTPAVPAPAVTREDDEDDDVEAHSNFGSPQVP